MAIKRELLIDILRSSFLPELFSAGFEQADLKGPDASSREIRIAFPFGSLRRAQGQDLHLLEIQFDKHGVPRFVLNFGVVGPGGVDVPWRHFSQLEAGVSALQESYRLYSSRHSMKWFEASRLPFPFDVESRASNVVGRLRNVYPEVEAWFSQRVVGPHMRRLGYPIRSREPLRSPS